MKALNATRLALVLFCLGVVPAANAANHCSGVYLNSWLSNTGIGTTLSVREESAEQIRFSGWVHGQATTLYWKTTSSGTRLEGWMGYQPIALRVEKKSDTETRMSGRAGLAGIANLTIKKEKPNEVRMSGLLERGSLYLRLYRDTDGKGRLNGNINRVSVNMDVESDVSGALDASGVLATGTGSSFFNASIDSCLNDRALSEQVSVAEGFLLFVLANLG